MCIRDRSSNRINVTGLAVSSSIGSLATTADANIVPISLTLSSNTNVVLVYDLINQTQSSSYNTIDESQAGSFGTISETQSPNYEDVEDVA